ncbi:hypothetical protein C8R43DRAFT_1128949 [Mycena crocata]|nr:hypothetical protein C8R43DRAFT_1128949 [Mycena crocata]
MPNVQKLLTDQGVLYQRHYCTIALCCPSRVSLLIGKAAQCVHGSPATRAAVGALGWSTTLISPRESARVIGPKDNLFYTVWCDNSHDLFDMDADPYQLENLFTNDTASSLGVSKNPSYSVVARDINHLWSHSRRRLQNHASVTDDFPQLAARLDALTMVPKSCKADACRKPWNVLHPDGDVKNPADAMADKFDDFYASQRKVSFSECSYGYLIETEGPQDVIPYAG